MIDGNRQKHIFDQFKKKKILVYGDVILDKYIWGMVNRISPEAPVPVVKIDREEFRLGGAGNVATNLDRLGAEGILIGVSGNDFFSQQLSSLKQSNMYLYQEKDRQTFVKTRVISQRQQIVRIDREDNIQLSSETERNIIQKVNDLTLDGIIISDYAKGTLNSTIIEGLKKKAKSENIPIIVDPKPPHFSLYHNVDGITPNLKEAEMLVSKEIITDSDAADAVSQIQKHFNTKFSLITRGDRGITAIEDNKQSFHLPALSHEVYDVTGAGDTVIALLMLSLVSGATLEESVYLANVAASLVVEKVGTSDLTITELENRIKVMSLS